MQVPGRVDDVIPAEQEPGHSHLDDFGAEQDVHEDAEKRDDDQFFPRVALHGHPHESGHLHRLDDNHVPDEGGREGDARRGGPVPPPQPRQALPGHLVVERQEGADGEAHPRRPARRASDVLAEDQPQDRQPHAACEKKLGLTRPLRHQEEYHEHNHPQDDEDVVPKSRRRPASGPIDDEHDTGGHKNDVGSRHRGDGVKPSDDKPQW
mmetsp:Transcript_37958/g.114699  ORF Transcript_37958/g.114699 Transcript_37958/m.114699 type:complete len:208 (-) Transcript_37958:674-1297(-)